MKRKHNKMLAMMLSLVLMSATIPVASVSASINTPCNGVYASSSYVKEWDEPTKTTEGARSFYLKNRKTGITYRINNADDYAKIRYGRKSAVYSDYVEFNNILHNLFDCELNHVHTYAPVTVGIHVYFGCLKCAKLTTYAESRQSRETFAWRMYDEPYERLSYFDKWDVRVKWTSYRYGVSIYEAMLSCN